MNISNNRILDLFLQIQIVLERLVYVLKLISRWGESMHRAVGRLPRPSHKELKVCAGDPGIIWNEMWDMTDLTHCLLNIINGYRSFLIRDLYTSILSERLNILVLSCVPCTTCDEFYMNSAPYAVPDAFT